jgi:hypothetical protein
VVRSRIVNPKWIGGVKRMAKRAMLALWRRPSRSNSAYDRLKTLSVETAQ